MQLAGGAIWPVYPWMLRGRFSSDFAKNSFLGTCIHRGGWYNYPHLSAGREAHCLFFTSWRNRGWLRLAGKVNHLLSTLRGANASIA
jgi:hypothetical protein